jgi:hypothetical protein
VADAAVDAPGRVVAILRGAAARPKKPRVARHPRLYPIAMFVPLYSELSALTNLFTHLRYDMLVAGWEQAIFGSQPSQTLRLLLPGEGGERVRALQLLLLLLRADDARARLYVSGQRAKFLQALTATLLSFLACCLVYMLFPVVGPYHHFGHRAASSWPACSAR